MKSTVKELVENHVRRPQWIISDHAWVRWHQRWREYDMLAELNASKSLGRAKAKRVRSLMPSRRSRRQVYFLSPCGAVFVVARNDLKTVITVFPPLENVDELR